MQNNIYTLIPDIHEIVSKEGGWFHGELASTFSKGLEVRLQDHFGERGEARLRMSKLGLQCPHALWHSIKHPELAEPLPPAAKIKYTYGHMIESMAIMLTKASGHLVTGEQDEVELDGVRGHRDCVIDGNIVDVKSCSSMGFLKFKNKTLPDHDDFGYLDQLDAYLVGSYEDPLVTNKDSAFIFAIEKTLGHMCLYEHRVRPDHIRNRIRYAKKIVGMETAPRCECGVIPDGESGNLRLDIPASYNAFKHVCFPGLRTFIYSKGPVYLTKVVKHPRNKFGPLPEVDRYGNPVYN